MVSVVHPGRLTKKSNRLDQMKNVVRYALRECVAEQDPRVRLLCVPPLAERFLPGRDVVIATARETAEWVSQYCPSKGRGLLYPALGT